MAALADAQKDLKASLERVAKVPPGEALDVLLSAWASHPAREIADAIAAASSPLDVAFAAVTMEGAADAFARLSRLTEVPRDPRASVQLVAWVADPPYHATSSKPFHRLVLSEIVRHSDPRAIAGLAKAGKSAAKAIKGKSMRTWVIAEVPKTIALLREQHPDGVPQLPRGLARVLAAAAKRVAAKENDNNNQPRVASSRAKAAADLLEAIRRDPSDDAAREVYADHLLEKGDPRGELIALQLRRAGREPTAEEKGREIALLRKHARTWLGELASVIARISAVMVGPVSATGAEIRFERGFLAGCHISGSKQKLRKLMGHPDLATVDELNFAEEGRDAEAFLEDPVFRGLKHLTTNPSLVPAAVRASFGQGLRSLMLSGYDGDDFHVDAVARGLPSLRELTIQIWSGEPNEREVWASLAAIKAGLTSIPTLEQLSCTNYGEGVEATFRRAAPSAKWSISFADGADDDYAKQLRALCR